MAARDQRDQGEPGCHGRRALAAAIAEADTGARAAEIDVVREGTAWKVRLTPMPDTARFEENATA